MFRKHLVLLIAISLCFSSMAFADHHEGDDHPPMLVLMPPPDVEKPEGVEMTGDPKEDFRTVFRTFFQLMDQDGSGELSRDELRGWVHPGPGPGMGEHDDGMMGDHEDMGEHDGMGDGDMAEEIRMLKEELRRVHEEQRMRHREHMQEQIQRAREHLRQLEEDAGRMEEEQNTEGGQQDGNRQDGRG
jgi:hypothetical protein